MLNDSAGVLADPALGAVYGMEDLGAARELRALIADLEGADDAWLVPSGLAAVTVPLMALLKPGEEVVTTDACYGPTRRFLTRGLSTWGVASRFHPAEATTDEVLATLTPATRLLLIESPASLTFEMLDVTALTAACRARGVLTLMDNTWAAGIAFRPLEHGVDVSVQALTKYVGGHSDLLMGSIATRDPVLHRRIGETIEDQGWRSAPDEAWLALRGLRTLPLRYREQGASALRVAEWLAGRPEIARVMHPALPGSVGHDLWQRDYSGAASLIGLVMNGGDEQASHAFVDALELFGIGYSWGGFESLITPETRQLKRRTHAPVLQGPLLRLHIGLEDPDDLIADLDEGLAAWRARQDSNLQPSA